MTQNPLQQGSVRKLVVRRGKLLSLRLEVKFPGQTQGTHLVFSKGMAKVNREAKLSGYLFLVPTGVMGHCQ